MPQPNDLTRSLVALDQDSTIIAVVEMSQSSWLVAGMLPGIERQPRKKLEPSAERLLGLLHRWRDEAVKAGRQITRIALAFEAGRDGFWLARWLRAHGVEAHVIHPSSVAVSREHRRAKTDRLDTELLKRGVLGWLRGARGHCSMARVPSDHYEDRRRRSARRVVPGFVRGSALMPERLYARRVREVTLLVPKGLTPELRREAHRAVHRPSACSGVKALRNTSDAKAARRQAALAFRSLDPFRALREPDRRRRTKNGFPAPNKERSAKPTKQPLDRKSPIQVSCEPDFIDQGGDADQRRAVPPIEIVGYQWVLLHEGPRVRIRLPPAASLLRT